MIRTILLFLVVLTYVRMNSQVFFNGDFEFKKNDTLIDKWFFGKSNVYKMELDTNTVYSGKQSLRFRSLPSATNLSGGVCFQYIDLTKFGIINEVTAIYRVKIEKPYTPSSFYPWFILCDKYDRGGNNTFEGDTINNFFQIDSLQKDWYIYKRTLVASDTNKHGFPYTQMRFGFRFLSKATFNIDNIEIYVNNKKVEDLQIKEIKRNLPTDQEIELAKKNIIPLKITDNDFNNFNNVQFLDKTIGNAKLVALGEPTHGSKEINEMRFKIINYLIKKKGFSVIALEQDMHQSYPLNDWLTEGKISDYKMVDSGLIRIYNTKEYIGLVAMIRLHNKQNKNKISIDGYDFSFYYSALKILRDTTTNFDDSLLAQANTIAKIIKKPSTLNTNKEIFEISTNMTQYVRVNKNLLKKKYKDLKKLMRIEKCIESLYFISKWQVHSFQRKEKFIRTLDTKNGNERDSIMAENIAFLQKYYQNKKMIIICHNEHIRLKNYNIIKSSDTNNFKTMGNFLSMIYPKGTYKSYAFMTSQGTATSFNAINGHADIKELNANDSNSYEFYFKKFKAPLFFMDLNNKKLTTYNKPFYLISSLQWQSIGFSFSNKQNYFKDIDLSVNFNGIFFIRNTTASQHNLRKNYEIKND